MDRSKSVGLCRVVVRRSGYQLERKKTSNQPCPAQSKLGSFPTKAHRGHVRRVRGQWDFQVQVEALRVRGKEHPKAVQGKLVLRP